MSGLECRDSSFSATILALLMVVTSLSPLAMAEDVDNDDSESFVRVILVGSSILLPKGRNIYSPSPRFQYICNRILEVTVEV